VSVSVEQFVHNLVTSGVMTVSQVRTFLDGLAFEERPKDGARLAYQLVGHGAITLYQAKAIYHGKQDLLRLQHYLILDKVGQGATGGVFRARHGLLNRVVALKVLSPEVTRSREAVKRFRREIRTVARLVHPNLVQALDADVVDGRHFLAMAFVEGKDLASLVREQGPLSLEQALNCVLQTAQGLEYVHTQGVVHRDVKPANLMLDSQGTVKILDLGLVRLLLGPTEDSLKDLSDTGFVRGTVDFMAPEQAINSKLADLRADIYSLGMTLHYLLTGRAAYEGQNVIERLLAHREQPVPSLRARRADVSPALDSVYRKMVAKQPDDRYPSMTEVIAELQACQLSGLSALAPASNEGHPLELADFFAELERDAGPKRTGGREPVSVSPALAAAPESMPATRRTKGGTPPATPRVATLDRPAGLRLPRTWRRWSWLIIGPALVGGGLFAWSILGKGGNAPPAGPNPLAETRDPPARKAKPRGRGSQKPPAAPSAEKQPVGQALIDGQTLAGWTGALEAFQITDGHLASKPGQGGWLFTERTFKDFELVFEFRLFADTKSGVAKSGVALRSPLKGDPRYDGLEVELVDGPPQAVAEMNRSEQCGGIHGISGSLGARLNSVGEWNEMKVTCCNRLVRVKLNGAETTIVDLDGFVSGEGKLKASHFDNREHPGVRKTEGHLGLICSEGRVEFRNLRVRDVSR
jgi:serine/threonine protein kinase